MTGPAGLSPGALARLAEELPLGLASAAARDRVAALAVHLPGGAQAGILEMRLDGRGEAVDVSLAFSNPGLPALAQALRNTPLRGVLDWAAGPGRPRSLWLEWDLPDGGTAADAAVPSLFLGRPMAEGDDRAHWQAALQHLGRGALAERLDTVLDILPKGVTLRQLGVMLSRSDPVVRLVLDTGTPDRAQGLIAALDDTLCPALGALFASPGFAAATRLDLDLLPQGIGPRLSLELACAGLAPVEVDRGLRGLAGAGLADGAAVVQLAGIAPWHGAGPGLTAGLNHLKASALGGGIEVKAYLGLVAVPG